tara:strand:- start:259 stop:495 length:237 start_codon:yes stop_codon:yes gene_type:complete
MKQVPAPKEPNPELVKAEAQWDLELKNPNLDSHKFLHGVRDIAHLGIIVKSCEVCFNAATDVLYMEKLRSFTLKDTSG